MGGVEQMRVSALPKCTTRVTWYFWPCADFNPGTFRTISEHTTEPLVWSYSMKLIFWNALVSKLSNVILFVSIVEKSRYVMQLTLQWWRGSTWTLKSVFEHQCRNAEYPDTAVSGLLHAYHPTSSGMCLKKHHAQLQLGSLWTPPLTTNGTTLHKNNYPYTCDLWPLVAIHKCRLMLLSHISTN